MKGIPGGPGRVQAGSLVCNPGIEAKFYTLLHGHVFFIYCILYYWVELCLNLLLIHIKNNNRVFFFWES